jgi:hypothetical protein
VSTRTRCLAFIGKDSGQLFFGHPWRGAILADPIADALEPGSLVGRSRS